MTSFVPPDAEIRRRRLLGVGLRAELVSSIDIARDISLTVTANGTDLAAVSGFDNLCQALAVGLTTLRGSDVFNQRYGFLGLTALTEQTSPVLAREGVRSAVAEFLAGDPRVHRIVDLRVDDPMSAGGGADRGVATVRVSFETITGQTATLTGAGLASGQDWGAVATVAPVGSPTPDAGNPGGGQQ